MSDTYQKENEMNRALKVCNLIHEHSHHIKMLERAGKAPAPSPTTYQNNQALVEKVAALTTKVAEPDRLISQSATLPTPPTPPMRLPGLPRLRPLPPPLHKHNRANVNCRKASKPCCTSTPVAPLKRDRWFIFTRKATLIPAGTSTLSSCNASNNAIPITLVAKMRFPATHNIQLVAVSTFTCNILLPSVSSCHLPPTFRKKGRWFVTRETTGNTGEGFERPEELKNIDGLLHGT